MMIELYHTAHCTESADYEAALQDMVVSHKVIVVMPDQLPETLPAGIELPALKDSGQFIVGPAKIATHLKELEKFVADWRRFQGDSCYIADDGEVC